MRYYTHLALGLLSALILIPFLEIHNNILFISLVLLGSLLPDIDYPKSKISNKIPILPFLIKIISKHRGIFHSLFAAIIISSILYLISPTASIALFIGYLSHLIIDSLTKSGINFLYPFTKLRISGFIKTGSYQEFLVFIAILLIIIIKLI